MNPATKFEDLKSDGKSETNGDMAHINEPSVPSNRPIIAEQPIYTKRELRVVCAGAGMAGLTLAYVIQHTGDYHSFITLSIYEKNSDIGGTWFENSYPGVACDVPAHHYSFPFAPNPNWTAFYASGLEIQEYFRKTTKQFNLDKHVELRSRVVDAKWDEKSGQWKLKIDQPDAVKEDVADVFINATGPANKWAWPSIEGLNVFKGPLCHSANWNHDYDWAGKRVAVIGNGASAIQILPSVQKTAAKVVTYARSLTYITPTFGGHMGDQDPDNYGGNFIYSEERKKEFRENPEAFSKYLRELENVGNGAWMVYIKDHPLQKMVQSICKQMMIAGLGGDEELATKMTPKDYLPGCRRLTPGREYLRALQERNVTLHQCSIERIGDHTIYGEDGNAEEVDLIVCATGFDTSFIPPWSSVGRGDHRLDVDWAETPKGYAGTCAANYPNYFITAGPGTPVTAGSFFRMMYWKMEYIVEWLEKMAADDIKTVCVKQDAVDDYDAYSEEFFKRTVYVDGCRSWYKSGKKGGKVTAVYPGSPLHYREFLQKLRPEDFDVTYRSRNRFRCLGNGLTSVEVTGGDLAPYWSEEPFRRAHSISG